MKTFLASLLIVLLAAGALFATGSGIFGLLLLATPRRMRMSGINLLRGVVLLVIYGLSVLNNFIHTRDAWTSVVPTGLALSAATACLVIIAAILRGLVHRDDARWEGV